MTEVCKLSPTQRKEFDSLINKFNNARLAIENFLTELKGEWETDLGEQSQEFLESDAGQQAEERLGYLDEWIDDTASDFEPNLDSVA